MSDLDNIPKIPKKLGPLTLTRKNIIKICAGSAIVICAAIAVNSYLGYQHQIFLEKYSNAIASLQNKESSGYDEAFKTLKELDDDGEATPMDYFYLGYALQYGYGTPKEYDHAFKYYYKSLKNKNPRAYYQIGTLYEAGHGVNKNHTKAISYYKKSYDLGYSPAIVKIYDLFESNSRLRASADPKLLYSVYEAINDNKISDMDESDKNKYLLSAVAEGYEPALIKQAQNSTDEGDNNRALMLWQTLLYSSNPATSKKATTKIDEIQKVLKKERVEEKSEADKIQVQEKEQEKEEIIKQVERQKEIEHKILKGLSTPKKDLASIDGLIFLNLFNVDKQNLQNFYKNIADVTIEPQLLKNTQNIHNSFIDDFLKIAKLKENKSSVFVEFSDTRSTNKFEGLSYYYFNDNDKFTRDLLKATLNNKAKPSSLLPKYTENEIPTESANKENVQNTTNNIDEEAEKPNTIELTHEEQMQRLQVFAQKGDYKKLYKLEKIAHSDDPYAMYFTGEYYYNVGDHEKAVKFFKEAANAGYGPANYRLGELYYNEERNGVPFDKNTAMKYYERAAKLGVRNAKHILMLLK